MARYIDADALLERMRLTYCKDCNNYNEIMCRSCLMDDALITLEDCPTADVAPKSEVIDEILSLIDDKIRFEVEMYNGFHSLKNCKTICQERVNALNDLKLIINHQFRAELKNKYTEGKK